MHQQPNQSLKQTAELAPEFHGKVSGRRCLPLSLAMLETTPMDLTKSTTREILALFVSSLDELKRRGVTRSTNNPVADYGEALFESALGLTLSPKSTKGYDATDSSGKKYEIKGRRLTAHNTSRQLSAIRALDNKHFDLLAGVLFDANFSVLKACLIPHEQVGKISTYRSHTNSWILILRDGVWQIPGVIDVTEQLRRAEKAYG